MTLLSAQQLDRITTAVSDLTPAQLAWVGGYLSGLSMGPHNVIPFPQAQDAANQQAQAAAAPEAAISTTILFGSQTGNSQKIAEQLHQPLSAQGLPATLKSLKDYRPQQLKKEQRVVFVVSTHGNGEPPDDARSFFQFINSSRAPKLDGIEFAVLALGDSSYEEFCQTGVDLDQRLEALGGQRCLARIDCDVDFADEAAEWQQHILAKIQAESSQNNAFQTPTLNTTQSAANSSVGTAEAPWAAELLAVNPLTDVDSNKDVLHLEFSLEDSGISYQPGDIAAVLVNNDAALVDALLTHTQLDATTNVQLKKQSLPLRDALLSKLEISTVTRKQLQNYAEQINHSELTTLAADKTALVDWLYAADWLDVLQEYPATLDAQALVDLLRPLKPREYSIASSLEAHPEELHLMVKRVAYTHNEREHLGTGSNWLARLAEGEQAQVYLKPNAHFKLPTKDDTKIIMVGAGTGVAPFRSFLFEREAQGITGNSWLFFGEQHFRSEFLYQAEWLDHLKTGVLEKMSVAFSRDQAEKVYVQHRLLENGAELWQWLQDGAHFYVCGDMHKMAKDVHAALLQIAIEHGGHTPEQADAWLESLVQAKRYQRDVY